jgi:hypothetical protein
MCWEALYLPTSSIPGSRFMLTWMWGRGNSMQEGDKTVATIAARYNGDGTSTQRGVASIKRDEKEREHE